MQGQFYFGRTHLSEYIFPAWQCVGWTISTMKNKVCVSLTSSSFFKGEKRKHQLSNRKVKKKVWKMNCRHFRSRWESILAVSWNHWEVTEDKDGWNIKCVNSYDFVYLGFVGFFYLLGSFVCFFGFGASWFGFGFIFVVVGYCWWVFCLIFFFFL